MRYDYGPGRRGEDANSNAQAAIIGTAGQGPTVDDLHLAMVQGAVLDAVNAIDGGDGLYLGVPPTAARGWRMAVVGGRIASHVSFPTPMGAVFMRSISASLIGCPRRLTRS